MSDKHTIIGHDGTRYGCIGYETRGSFSVPIAEIVNGDCIQADVYEITHGMRDNDSDCYISLCRPNSTELALLKSVGWKYNGAFAHKA